MPLDFPLVSDVSLFHLCTKRPSILHSHSILQTECSTLHKSDCVWQNGRARFLHIDFTRINSLCPKHTYTCFCSSFMLVVCWLFLLTKALFSNCCDRRSGGLCDKKLGAKCGLEDIKSPSIPSNASTNWGFLSPSTIYFFSWRELAETWWWHWASSTFVKLWQAVRRRYDGSKGLDCYGQQMLKIHLLIKPKVPTG